MHLLQSAMRMPYVAASTLGADQPVLADGIVNDAGDGLALDDDAQHDAEQRHARGEIEGAVDWIDDEGKIGFAEALEQRRVVGAGFLADDHRLGVALTQPDGDEPLSIHVGLRHQVGCRGLLADLALIQPSKARHDLGNGGVGQKLGKPVDRGIVKCHRERLAV